MKTVKKKMVVTLDIPIDLDVPIGIQVVDSETNEVLGEGSGTVKVSKTVTVTKEVEYSYEVPTISDFIIKGVVPATGISTGISYAISKMRRG